MTKRETPSVEFLDIETLNQPEFSGPSGVAVTIETARTARDFVSLENEWNVLVDRADVTIYQTFDWLRLWWKHFGAGPFLTLFILVVRRNRDLLCIAPFCIRSELMFGFRMNRRLELMGGEVSEGRLASRTAPGGPSDYLDIIVAPGSEQEVAVALVQFLREHSTSFEEIVLNNVPETSVLLGPFLQALDAAGIRSSVRTSDVCPRVEVPPSLQEFMSGLDGHVGRRIRRAVNNFKDQPAKSIQHIRVPKEFDSAYRDLMTLHQMRWNRLGYLGSFADDRFRAFQADVGRVFLKRDWLWFKTASMAGVRIGARMGFKFKDRMYDYLSGFDDRAPWAKTRPGLALLACMLEDAARSGFKVLDLLRGGEDYKFELTSHVCYNRTISFKFPENRKGRFTRVSRFVVSSRHILRRIRKETIIFRLHLAEHGPLLGFRPYFTFLKSRVFRKEINTRGGGSTGAKPKVVPRSRTNHEGPAQKVRTTGLSMIHGGGDLASKLSARIYLWKCNVVGKNARVSGRPIIRNMGRIKIGEDFFMNSSILRTKLMTGRNGHVEIGHGVKIGFGTTIAAQELIKIGNRVRIGHSVTILDADEVEPKQWYSSMTAEEVVIEDDVLIENRAKILKGSRIPRGSVIQEGSTVSGSPTRLGKPADRKRFVPPGTPPETGARQSLVNHYFDQTAPYWRDVYGTDSLDGVIYRLRSGEVLASVETLNLPSRSNVMEVGCGAGMITIGLARKGFVVTAIDSSEIMVELAAARVAETGYRGTVTVRKEDVHALHEPDGRFDAAVVVGVVPWLHSPERALKEIVRVLKPGGFLIVTADNRWRLNHLIDPRLSPLLSPARRWFHWLLGAAGFSKSPSEVPPAALHSPQWIDQFLERLGTRKVWSKTVGFGPFTLWGKEVLSDRAGVRLHTILQSVADIGFPLVRLTGSHYLVQAQKDQDRHNDAPGSSDGPNSSGHNLKGST